MNYIGWDLSTKRSGITKIDTSVPLGYKVLARWSKGPATRNPSRVVGFFEDTVEKVFKSQPSSVIAIDWSLSEAHMRGNRQHTLLKGLVAGIIFSELKKYNHFPVFISPLQVRKNFYLASNTSKENVAKAFAEEWRSIGFQVSGLNKLNEHTLDALILAYIASTKKLTGKESVFFQVSDNY